MFGKLFNSQVSHLNEAIGYFILNIKCGKVRKILYILLNMLKKMDAKAQVLFIYANVNIANVTTVMI